ncbi:MAG TPA: transcription termination/antitermination NusG family protein [Pyrinomonadaceae bacterium]
MSCEQPPNVPAWYAVHTRPNQESRAIENLRAWRVETFSPRIKVRRSNRISGAITYVTNHLYPSYILARFDASTLLHKIQFTRGVSRVVSFGSLPTPVDERIIEIIKSRINADGFVQIGEKLKYGDKVIVEDGPFRYFAGMFESETDESERVRILLTTIGYQAHIHVDRNLVKRADARA